MITFITTIFSNTISFLKKNPTFLLMILVVVLVWIFAVIPLQNDLKYERESRMKFEKTVIQNVQALQDSVQRKIDENGDVYSEKLSLAVSSLDQLALYDEQLYKKLITENQNLKSYIDSELRIVLAEVGHVDSDLNHDSDSTFEISTIYHYADSGLTHSFESTTPVSYSIFNNKLNMTKGQTNVLQNEFQISLEYQTIQDENGTRVVAKSPSDFVYFEDINSVYVDKDLTKPDRVNSRFGVGPNVGVAWTPAGLQPYIGVGVNWNAVVIKKKNKK